jgi:hypothetical protein
MISTDTIGKEEATNRTILGSASATKGGVVAAAQVANMVEFDAAQNLSNFTSYCIGFGV